MYYSLSLFTISTSFTMIIHSICIFCDLTVRLCISMVLVQGEPGISPVTRLITKNWNQNLLHYTSSKLPLCLRHVLLPTIPLCSHWLECCLVSESLSFVIPRYILFLIFTISKYYRGRQISFMHLVFFR